MTPLPAFFCCAPIGPREFIVIAALAFAFVGIPLWAWVRKQNLSAKRRDDNDALPRG